MMVLCVTLTTNDGKVKREGDAIFHFITRPPYGEYFTTVYLILLVYEISINARAAIYYTNSCMICADLG